MESSVIDSLEDLGYSGKLLEEGVFDQDVAEGPVTHEFSKVVEWCSKEIAKYYQLEEHVNAINSPDDEDSFLMELSGFLREFGCPYSELTDGPISKRLESKENKLTLLDFLLSEMGSARIIQTNKPKGLPCNAKAENGTSESNVAFHLKKMLVALGFSKPPEGITSFQLFSKAEAKVKELSGKVSAEYLSKPFLKARLSDKQWETVEFINKALTQEYEIRRQMLIKRLDVTIQSFKWSEAAKKKGQKVNEAYDSIKDRLTPQPSIDIHSLLAAREDLLNIQRISTGAARQRIKCEINKVQIGRVPDRGGRAYEMEPPPPEMPAWQKERSQGGGGGRGGGGGFQNSGGQGGGGRGGFQQGRGGHRGSGWGSKRSYDDRDQNNRYRGGGGGGYNKYSKHGRY